MQAYGFNNAELINTEGIIFKFLLSTNENPNGINQIIQTIMKNDYSKGGMKVTDVESLDRSLNLKQFIRAHQSSNHVISKPFSQQNQVMNIIYIKNIKIFQMKNQSANQLKKL